MGIRHKKSKKTEVEPSFNFFYAIYLLNSVFDLLREDLASFLTVSLVISPLDKRPDYMLKVSVQVKGEHNRLVETKKSPSGFL